MINGKVKVIKHIPAAKLLLLGSRDALEEGTSLLESQVKLLAPVDTGRMRSSIFKKVKRFVGFVATGVYYAIFQERTANGGRGFMKPAARMVKTRLPVIFGKSIRKQLRRG